MKFSTPIPIKAIAEKYNCEIIDKGKEDDKIDSILNSFAQYSIN